MVEYRNVRGVIPWKCLPSICLVLVRVVTFGNSPHIIIIIAGRLIEMIRKHGDPATEQKK